jgi:uncharacterized protein GlcG (DUF336 family)
MLERMDGTQLGSIDAAKDKVYSAVSVVMGGDHVGRQRRNLQARSANEGSLDATFVLADPLYWIHAVPSPATIEGQWRTHYC